MVKAVWNGVILAQSNDTIEVEGNEYFPPSALHREYLQPSETHTHCSWKGDASYFNVEAQGNVNPDAAWYYPDPLPAAQEIKGYVAFWKGVLIER